MGHNQLILDADELAVIQSNHKTVLGRLIKPQPKSKLMYCYYGEDSGTWGYPNKDAYLVWGDEFRLPDFIRPEELYKRWTPPCSIGDVLNVQETFSTLANTGEAAPKKYYKAVRVGKHLSAGLLLLVLDVRIERLQNIAVGQAQCAEMIRSKYPNCGDKKWFWVIEFERIGV